MRTSYTLLASASEALRVFRTFDEGTPDLVPTGLGPVDRSMGGVFPGSGGVLGMAQGVGKTSTILSAAVNSGVPTGIVSLEDGPDVFGSRALAMVSGVNSLRIRKKEISDQDKEDLAVALEKLDDIPVYVEYPIGGGIEDILDAVDELALRGCRMVWLDYLQKRKELASANRHVVVSETMSRFQRRCAEHNMAYMVASQFSRKYQPTERPNSWWFKESGDIENEARIIVLGWREEDDPGLVNYVLDKSTYGGEGISWQMRRDGSGTLREVERRV